MERRDCVNICSHDKSINPRKRDVQIHRATRREHDYTFPSSTLHSTRATPSWDKKNKSSKLTRSRRRWTSTLFRSTNFSSRVLQLRKTHSPVAGTQPVRSLPFLSSFLPSALPTPNLPSAPGPSNFSSGAGDLGVFIFLRPSSADGGAISLK